MGSHLNDFSSNFRRCRLGEDTAEMIPVHHQDGRQISFSCDFQGPTSLRLSEMELAETGMPLEVVDSES